MICRLRGGTPRVRRVLHLSRRAAMDPAEAFVLAFLEARCRTATAEDFGAASDECEEWTHLAVLQPERIAQIRAAAAWTPWGRPVRRLLASTTTGLAEAVHGTRR
ncbi:hypothetical protein [Planomonospora sp. ID82291]|uniref:hypothetical protein n=1 Tax=Planomonospora sp. ID82291 TaxID=2738136 RepID=UPI0018C403B0|nr:hypothetical protein [Planomonospora sp. ID82291]MBG0819084.1 hypothetical protein [Planomonospora sp. ID82291]